MESIKLTVSIRLDVESMTCTVETLFGFPFLDFLIQKAAMVEITTATGMIIQKGSNSIISSLDEILTFEISPFS